MAKHGVTAFLSVFNDETVKFCKLETDLLLHVDKTGRIRRVWGGFVQATGYDESDVLGIEFARLIYVEDIAIFLRNFSWFDRAKPFRLYHKGGGEVKVELINFECPSNELYLILRVVP